ncbi:glycogen debranching protein GlgX [Sphingomonas sp. SUN019]|uniref:glycogen debranching protein GlgX n=1 Tax=Sphingomonas sp. SUN019 TaxID=2937788 RepID=UPI0021642A85|nr:glycogen debranching protein GlgX [Sphingomonas sp. SUN019]UVO49866.1 glycogen debranching protein GlgX [Sphingomonas sp. SUN019]
MLVAKNGAIFTVRAPRAETVWLCLFSDEAETRHTMTRTGDNWTLEVEGITPGQRYGYRAAGPAPHDETKLLVDPYATTLDRRFTWHPDLATPGAETAHFVPKALVTALLAPVPAAPAYFHQGGLIYELNVRGFTMLHPDVPAEQRGTVAALAHPAIIAHLLKLRVAAVELMPIVAWIDERHLAPLGLTNAWGYNPVVPMALDPGLCPGGLPELRATIETLHAAGIGVILDLVFNHSGESDLDGPTLSFRGLDDAAYARDPDGDLINDTGTGNTFDFANPAVRDLTLATLRHFAEQGVDGFRFDLAPVIARGPGFDPAAPIFDAIAADPLLSTRVMIAEPWDIGPGGYQLGNFPATWLEWNDRFRDDVRRFWRGGGDAGTLATRLSGSPDIFGDERTRTVNFIAAHDGFTLADLVSHAERHNHANGEDNRDGHADEIAWNNGVEGPSDDPAIITARAADSRALLATLFAARGTIMLTAGDEFGRTHDGNNNAYAQDNPTTWLDWTGRDLALEDYVAGLASHRAAHPEFSEPAIRHDATWRRLDGAEMNASDWAMSDGFRLDMSGATVTIDRVNRFVRLDDA